LWWLGTPPIFADKGFATDILLIAHNAKVNSFLNVVIISPNFKHILQTDPTEVVKILISNLTEPGTSQG
jgi:hypothetical protein